MKWPWQRQSETERAAPSVLSETVEEIIARSAEIVKREVGEEIARVMIASSPMVGVPDPASASPKLYAWDNPLWYSAAQAPIRRPGSLVTIQTLRQLADTYDVLRSCINHIKDEVFAVPLDIVAKDAKDERDETKAAIAEARAWFAKRGGLGGPGFTRRHFESKMIEDLCVIGAAAMYHTPTRGGKVIASTENIDAATIRPVVDPYGWRGDYPWEQWILGVRVLQMKDEELTYDGLFPKSYSPYFWSPVEWLVYTVNRALRSDQWNEAWLTDGTTAADIMAMPDNWTPEKVMSWKTYWDAMMSGDSKSRQTTKFVPSGTQRVGNPTRKDQDFQAYELWLLRRTCAIMGVHPAAIGFVGEQFAVTQEQSMDATSEFGVGKYLTFRKDFYDAELERIGFPDLEAVNVTAKEDNATDRALRLQTLIKAGVMRLNEARALEGMDPDPDGDVLLVENTLVPLSTALIPPPDPLEMVKATAQAKAASNDGGNSGSSSGSGGSGSGSSTRAELSRWEKKAITRFRSGKSASVAFESEDIRPAVRRYLEDRLQVCTSPEAIRALFREAANLDEGEAAERTDWAARVVMELEALAAV